MTPTDTKIPKRAEIPGLQILKIICAFLIVLIHVPSQASIALKPVLRIAVPIFLMISGYFLVDTANKGSISRAQINKSIRKIFFLIIDTNAIYIVFWIIYCYFHPEVLGEYFTFGKIAEFIFFGNTYCAAFWYLTGYLEALLILLLIVRFRLENFLLIILPLGIILSIVLGKYWVFLNDHVFRIQFSRNFFTVMLPCLTLGMLVRQKTNFFLKFANPWIIGIFIVLLYLEEWFLMTTQPLNKGDIYIMTLPLATAVFVYFLKLKSTSKAAALLVKMGREHSMNIFLYHLLIANIIFLICGDILNDYLAYIVFFLAAIFSSFIRRYRIKL